MNLVDARVTKVIGKPVEKHKVWWLEVEYQSWSPKTDKTTLMFKTEKEALDVKPGHIFQT